MDCFSDYSDDGTGSTESSEVVPQAGSKRKRTAQPAATKTVARLPGGRHATAKKISHVLDVEDEIIFEMKKDGYKDADIAQRLVDEGYTKYKPQSVTTRYQRIKIKIAKHNDELLDEELTDWHEGEDYVLLQAYAKADERVEAELEKIRKRRFEYVSEIVNNTLDRPRFSARACRMRYDDLHDGTARPPPELDDDPESRQRETTAKKTEYTERLRTERQLSEQGPVSDPGVPSREEALAAADKRRAARAAVSGARKAAGQAEEDAKRTLKKNAREAKKLAVEQYRKDEERKAEETRIENLLLKSYKKAQKKADIERKAREVAEQAEQRRAAAHAAAGYSHLPEIGRSNLLPIATSASTSQLGSSSLIATPGPLRTGSAMSASDKYLAAKAAQSVPPYSTDADARLVMHKQELYSLLLERSIPRNRERDAKEAMSRRLYDSDWTLPIQHLQAMLQSRAQSAAGSRPDLVYRLVDFDVRSSRMFRTKHMLLLGRVRTHCDAVKVGYGGGQTAYAGLTVGQASQQMVSTAANGATTSATVDGGADDDMPDVEETSSA